MSRNRILAVGALLWPVAVIVGLAHLATCDWEAQALMVIVGGGWIAVRRGRSHTETV